MFLIVSHLYFYAGHLRFGHFRRNPHNRDKWRQHALHFVDTLFFLTCVRVRAEGLEHIPEDTVVFTANHQSYLDGLIVFHVIRRPFTAVTGPFEIFPHIVHEWFSHMGYMSVARDVFEELRYRDTVRLGRAVDHCVDLLRNGTSILIFPEGRREFKKHLLPFHLGVARMCLDAAAPAVPVVLEHVDTFLPATKHLLTPTRINVTIGRPVKLWEVSRNELVDTMYLERVLKKQLPESYFTERSAPHYVHGVRAAFFDLDDTLTRHNVFVRLTERYLLAHPNIHFFGKLLLVMYKGLTMQHGYFYRAAMRTLRGIRVAEFLRGYRAFLKLHKHNLFHPQMLELLESHRQKGNCVFIISEEPQDILDPIGELLGVPCFGTELEKKSGAFTGEVVGHIMKDEYKRDKVLELAHEYGIDLEKSYAYGDSYHDYAMLRSIGHAALVNPHSGFGTRCKKLGMRIIRQH